MVRVYLFWKGGKPSTMSAVKIPPSPYKQKRERRLRTGKIWKVNIKAEETKVPLIIEFILFPL